MFRYRIIAFYRDRDGFEYEIIWADSIADAVFTFEQATPDCEVVSVEKVK